MTVVTEPTALTLIMWRDYDPNTFDLPGVEMGARPAVGDPVGLAAAMYREGVRRVALSHPVDLDAGSDQPGAVWTMVMLRELTSWNIVVDWHLRVDSPAAVWPLLGHLHPPTGILGCNGADATGGAEIVTDWRRTFYPCKCVYRRGPGFIEVRDRRNASLFRFVIDDPIYLMTLDEVHAGAPVDALPTHVVDAFLEENLIGLIGRHAWWLPYRARRWPWPSMIV